MEVDCIPFEATGYFSKIIADYLNQDSKLKAFYTYEPKFEAFESLIANRNFEVRKRQVLSEALTAQYQRDGIKLKADGAVSLNITNLSEENCFTITTGHQLNLFTGPLYFVYKIVSAINLAKKLKEQYPDKQFVPVYWMASEDHDFEEISYFRFQGKKIQWQTEQTGAVGRMNPKELASIYEEFAALLTPFATHAEQLKTWFRKAYLEHETLSAATRYLAHELFKDQGLVIVDGDDVSLKTMFKGVVKEELLAEASAKFVSQQNEVLEKHYKLQVNPRNINLFYLTDDSRNRIEKVGEDYHVVDTDLKFSTTEILSLLEEHPERFSPNVLLRPVYQETILPNLAYIGGGGELAYWFQLKQSFAHFQVPFPMLLLRNSVMWMNTKQSKKYKALKISLEQLFQKEGVLTKQWVKENADTDLELKEEVVAFQKAYEALAEKAKSIDPTLEPHVGALGAKQSKSIKQLSEKMIRSERKQQTTATGRIQYLKDTLFPNGGLQERSNNFSEIYLEEGDHFIQTLLAHLELPSKDFIVIS